MRSRNREVGSEHADRLPLNRNIPFCYLPTALGCLFHFAFFNLHFPITSCLLPITVSFSFSLFLICLLLIPRYCFFHSSTHSLFFLNLNLSFSVSPYHRITVFLVSFVSHEPPSRTRLLILYLFTHQSTNLFLLRILYLNIPSGHLIILPSLP